MSFTPSMFSPNTLTSLSLIFEELLQHFFKNRSAGVTFFQFLSAWECFLSFSFIALLGTLFSVGYLERIRRVLRKGSLSPGISIGPDVSTTVNSLCSDTEGFRPTLCNITVGRPALGPWNQP